MKPYSQKIFTSQSEFRKWLEKNWDKSDGIHLVFYKKDSGKQTFTYLEAVDEALCFGWIDTTSRKRDEESYMQQFNPRKPKGTWTVLNKQKVGRLIKEGKIKHIGLSNENPWGVMRFLMESEKHGLPRIATIQNPFSLLNRLYEVGLSEIGMRENVGLLAYSPLGFGFLTGKHLNGIEKNSRLDLFRNFTRYTNDNCFKATKLYKELAEANGLTLTQMAIAFVHRQQFVTSTIIGATTMEQLQENIAAFDTILSAEMVAEIESIQELIPNPAP